jgi:hypothetical protein
MTFYLLLLLFVSIRFVAYLNIVLNTGIDKTLYAL